jgi:hypothetical protein
MTLTLILYLPPDPYPKPDPESNPNPDPFPNPIKNPSTKLDFYNPYHARATLYNLTYVSSTVLLEVLVLFAVLVVLVLFSLSFLSPSCSPHTNWLFFNPLYARLSPNPYPLLLELVD